MNKIFLGLDGGGTHTSALAVSSDGRILRRAEGPGLNYLIDGLETCVARFAEIVSSLLPSIRPEEAVICGGLAALDGPASPEILSAFQSALPPRCRLMLESDLTVALAGHTRGRPGLMVVCGTGSMALVRDRAGQEQAAGGWGWKIGDPGSGCMLAREGLALALFRMEAEGRQTPLLSAALRFFTAADPRALIPVLYAPEVSVDALAAFGAEVVALAEQEDPDALGILTRQMDQLAALAFPLLAAAPEAAERVGLFGGVFQHSALSRKLFSDALRSRNPVVRADLPACPPALGAVILAMLREGVPPEELPDFDMPL